MLALKERFEAQLFANGYELVDGVLMHEENAENFYIPPDVIKQHLGSGQFVELRIDSPRFSLHEETAEKCACPSCNGKMSKPILRHAHPGSLLPLPKQRVPSRGWGEDFWVRIVSRCEQFFVGVVDNELVESRLHELEYGDEIVFHEKHVLAVHGIHRHELLTGMSVEDLKHLAQWVAENQGKA